MMGLLPTTDVVCSFVKVQNPNCLLCGAEVQNPYCLPYPFALALWFQSPFELRIDRNISTLCYPFRYLAGSFEFCDYSYGMDMVDSKQTTHGQRFFNTFAGLQIIPEGWCKSKDEENLDQHAI